MSDARLTVADLGEKALIRDLVKPLFNPDDEPGGVGDDCAMLHIGGEVVLVSTDRVPADLIAFRLGILDYAGLGDYLARLNLSDIAACGGRALGLLLNVGMPNTLLYDDFAAICRGVHKRVAECGCKVLGGDITAATELSLSATSIGVASAGRVLTRRGAQAGDTVFVTRPAGLTPAAFVHFLSPSAAGLEASDETLLVRQFTHMVPMLELGQKLAESGACTSCMDNTDGIGQSLTELADASAVSIEVESKRIVIPEVVQKVAAAKNLDPLEIVFNAGADFSLIGTLQGPWTDIGARDRFGDDLQIVGRVNDGSGVWLRKDQAKTALAFRGWNYFVDTGSGVPRT